MQHQPLAGITVLDLGQIYNGPYCGYLLAMAGARVIKVEPPGGEAMRGRGDPPLSYPFMMLNGNKETVTLNLKSDAGREVLRDLARHADVLLENFAPGTLDRRGVGGEALTAINPRLIYASGTGFGRTGPHRDYRAMDITVQAMTGVMAITGHDGEPPLKAGPAMCDILGGVHLYAAITTALVRRERTGRGAVLDVAMQDAVFPSLTSALGAWYVSDGKSRRTGNHHHASAVAPYNVYAASDGHVAIICVRERHWLGLLDAMGEPELSDDPRFADRATRALNMAATDAVVEAWTSTLSKAEVFEVCQQHEVPCAPVQSLADVLNDTHLLERGALSRVAHERYGEVTLPNTPLRFQDVDPPPVSMPRNTGADNLKVYGDLLGLSADEVASLKNAGAI
ncbi:MAG: CoA transferase [Gammaproteobacteria bacterium]|nr:CoA transferase [Gammaproteobacteria bacterium]MYF27422.1 CoA transferase [Gammaproteobacteria bacterium]MYK48620.1 CoA transferase [Gammaproteobacteria bacterium]